MTAKQVVLCNPVGKAMGICNSNPADKRSTAKIAGRSGLQRGIVTLCIGGGQGIALALEML